MNRIESISCEALRVMTAKKSECSEALDQGPPVRVSVIVFSFNL